MTFLYWLGNKHENSVLHVIVSGRFSFISAMSFSLVLGTKSCMTIRLTELPVADRISIRVRYPAYTVQSLAFEILHKFVICQLIIAC